MYHKLHYSAIIALYECDFEALRKFEEEYVEAQFQKSCFDGVNKVIAPNLKFNEKGIITGIKLPIVASEYDKKIALSYLWKIKNNRAFVLFFYKNLQSKIEDVQKRLEVELS